MVNLTIMETLFYMDVLLISTTMGNLSNPFMFISKKYINGKNSE